MPEQTTTPDPTHGRIDRDIQAAVNDWGPTSLGQRVAIENTLQEQRDSGREPLTVPAESHQEPPADPDPHPDTPDQIRGNAVVIGTRMAPGYDPPSTSLHPHPDEATPPSDPHPDSGDTPGVLGRALLDRDGDVWRQHPAGGDRWRDQLTDPEAEWWPAATVARFWGPVREVLLVDPAAGRVLAAARWWVRAWEVTPFSPETAAAKAALAAAVDALTGGTEPASKHPAPGPDPEPAGDGPGWDREWLRTLWTEIPSASYAEPDLSDRVHREIDALLADHVRVAAERLREHNRAERAEHERDAARADLAEVTAERNRYRGDVERTRSHLRHTRADLERLQRRDGILIVKPDEDQLATARRDAAADALEEAADMADRWDVTCGRALRHRAADFRTGQRDVPGGQRG